jgi:hypothetical protein
MERDELGEMAHTVIEEIGQHFIRLSCDRWAPFIKRRRLNGHAGRRLIMLCRFNRRCPGVTSPRPPLREHVESLMAR